MLREGQVSIVEPKKQGVVHVCPEGPIGYAAARAEDVGARLLAVYLSPAAFLVDPRDLYWLVDFYYRMPGIALNRGGEATRIAAFTEGSEALDAELWSERFARESSKFAEPVERGDAVFHLVQDREGLDKIQGEELPPDEYYDALRVALGKLYPKADPALLDHIVPLAAAFDTGTAFGLSFGIKKFQLAQKKVKLVGEIVSREGRSPNPAIVFSIRNWPPINTLKDLQAFLGTANYIKAHAGPEYNRITAKLRRLMKKDAIFPPTANELEAIEELKGLVLEDHTLAVPDEFAAITAANAWMQGRSPEGRPYEMIGDSSGYAIGGVYGQCEKNDGDLRILMYLSLIHI